MIVVKPLGPEVNLASNNIVSNITGQGILLKVINTGDTGVLHFAYANGTEYANMTVTNTESVLVWKSTTDTLQGVDMFAVPVAVRG